MSASPQRQRLFLRLLSFLFLGLCIVFCPLHEAQGYSEPSHRRLTLLGIPNDLDLFNYDTTCPNEFDLGLFRVWIEETIRENIDGALLARFRLRYPETGDFAAPMSLRRFLGHNMEPETPGTTGIDRSFACGHANPAGLLAHGSMLPDTDKRNQNRLWRNADGVLERDRFGREIPIDPISLNMGNRTGLSSQAHAHYYIPYDRLSDDPEILKDTPERFALSMGWPEKPVMTFGDGQAQAHYDLAALATFWPNPHNSGLSWLHLGAALHYIQDAGNPIHTVQIGLYDFFKTAKIHSILENFLTAGGVLFDRLGFYQRGLNILSNHHLISEAIGEAIIYAGTENFTMAPYPGYDPWDFQKDLDPWALMTQHYTLWVVQMGHEPARDLVQRLAEIGAPEASSIYALTFEATSGQLHRGASKVPDEPTRVGNLLTRNTAAGAVALRALDPLLRRSLTRATFATELLIRRFHEDYVASKHSHQNAAHEKKAIVQRLVSARLNALDAEDARRAVFIRSPPDPIDGGIGWLYFFADLALIVLLSRLWHRWKQRSALRKAERYASSMRRTRKRRDRRRRAR